MRVSQFLKQEFLLTFSYSKFPIDNFSNYGMHDGEF